MPNDISHRNYVLTTGYKKYSRSKMSERQKNDESAHNPARRSGKTKRII
jgi:hypothetical protein